MSATKLSDRLVNSVSDLKEQFLAHPFVSEMLLKGEVANGKAVMTSEYKFYKDTENDWEQIIQIGVNKSETPEEKQFWEQLAGSVDKLQTKFETVFKQKFTDYDQSILSKPSLQQLYPQYQQKFAETLNKPMGDMLVTFMVILYTRRIIADLKVDPRFKSNWYYEFFAHNYDQIVAHFDKVKSLVDRRGADVSGQEEQHLLQVFRRGLEVQIKLLELKWIN